MVSPRSNRAHSADFAQPARTASGRARCAKEAPEPEKSLEPRDMREYHKKRRRTLHEKALLAVARYNGRPVECFVCRRTTRPLELNHLTYAPDSVLRGHSGERAEEALRHPERFTILCRGDHIALDLAAQQAKGPDPSVGSQVRAEKAYENRLGKRDVKEELVRRENVIKAVQAKNTVLDAEAQYYSDQLDQALHDLGEAASLSEELDDEIEALRSRP